MMWARFTGRAFPSVFTLADTVAGFSARFNPNLDRLWTYLAEGGFPPDTPVMPGETLYGFSHEGPAATTFLAAGPTDSPTFVGDAHDDPAQGVAPLTSSMAPEAATSVLLLAAAALGLRRRTLRDMGRQG